VCGRYTQTTHIEKLAKRFRAGSRGISFSPRYNLAPGQDAPVVVREEKNEIRLMRWGLVPAWAKEESIGYRMINARSETVVDKPSFRRAFKKRRCLVLADGFYEWKKEADQRKKTPMRIVRKDHEPFAFAGLWEQWQKPNGEALSSFTIVTTKANELLQTIHERMPVILQEKNEDLWLDPNEKDPERLFPLLSSFPSENMEAYEVSSVVNSAKNDLPECVVPRKFS